MGIKNIYILKTTPKSTKGKLTGTIAGGVLGASIGYLLNNSGLGDNSSSIAGVSGISPLKGASLGSLIGKNIGSIDDIFNSKELVDQYETDDDESDKILDQIKMECTINDNLKNGKFNIDDTFLEKAAPIGNIKTNT